MSRNVIVIGGVALGPKAASRLKRLDPTANVTMIDENPDLAFYVPKEGTNLFVDAMCIPKNAKNVSGAEKFINFMCSTEAAMANWEYVGYSSPQTEVYKELDEEITSDPLYFPDITQYPTEAYTNLPTEINQYYNDLWVDILT